MEPLDGRLRLSVVLNGLLPVVVRTVGRQCWKTLRLRIHVCLAFQFFALIHPSLSSVSERTGFQQRQQDGSVNSFLWRVDSVPPAFLFGTIHVPYTLVWDAIPENAKEAYWVRCLSTLSTMVHYLWYRALLLTLAALARRLL